MSHLALAQSSPEICEAVDMNLWPLEASRFPSVTFGIREGMAVGELLKMQCSEPAGGAGSRHFPARDPLHFLHSFHYSLFNEDAEVSFLQGISSYLFIFYLMFYILILRIRIFS